MTNCQSEGANSGCLNDESWLDKFSDEYKNGNSNKVPKMIFLHNYVIAVEFILKIVFQVILHHLLKKSSEIIITQYLVELIRKNYLISYCTRIKHIMQLY